MNKDTIKFKKYIIITDNFNPSEANREAAKQKMLNSIMYHNKVQHLQNLLIFRGLRVILRLQICSMTNPQ